MKEGRISKINFFTITVISLTLNILTKAGTSALMLTVLIMSTIIFSKLNVLFKFLIMSIFFIGIYAIFFQAEKANYDRHMGEMMGPLTGRSKDLLIDLVNDPVKLINKDISFALRSVSILVAVESMLQGNVFGNGVGTMCGTCNNLAKMTLEQSYLYNNLVESSPAFKQIKSEKREGESFSAIGLYTFELGFWFLLLLIWLYLRSIKIRYAYMTRLPISLFLIASFSIMFPPFWLLMAATDKRINTNLRLRV